MKLNLSRKPERNGEGSSSLGFRTFKSYEAKGEFYQLSYVLHRSGGAVLAFSAQELPDLFLMFSVWPSDGKYAIVFSTGNPARKIAKTITDATTLVGSVIAHAVTSTKQKNSVKNKRSKELAEWILGAIKPQAITST